MPSACSKHPDYSAGESVSVQQQSVRRLIIRPGRPKLVRFKEKKIKIKINQKNLPTIVMSIYSCTIRQQKLIKKCLVFSLVDREHSQRIAENKSSDFETMRLGRSLQQLKPAGKVARDLTDQRRPCCGPFIATINITMPPKFKVSKSDH